MSKRPKTDSLTGGTRDVNPQWWRLPTLSAGGITAGTPYIPAVVGVGPTAFPVPVQRLSQASGRAIVMEILKVRWNPTVAQTLTNTSQFLTLTARGYLATSTNNASPAYDYGPANPKVVSFFSKAAAYGRGNLDSTFLVWQEGETPWIDDLTDGAGHGVLVATDNIYASFWFALVDIGSTDEPSASGICECDILYRWKEVSLTEYIGIVQSQQ